MEYKGYYIEEEHGDYEIYESRDAWMNSRPPMHSSESLGEAQGWIDREIGAGDHPSNPRWTVASNIVSPESDKWVGTCWEFFNEEGQAEECYARQVKAGNCPTKRPFFKNSDREHLGAVHRY
jgi:hypothetical protein